MAGEDRRDAGPALLCKECGYLIPLSRRKPEGGKRVLVCPKCHAVNNLAPQR